MKYEKFRKQNPSFFISSSKNQKTLCINTEITKENSPRKKKGHSSIQTASMLKKNLISDNQKKILKQNELIFLKSHQIIPKINNFPYNSHRSIKKSNKFQKPKLSERIKIIKGWAQNKEKQINQRSKLSSQKYKIIKNFNNDNNYEHYKNVQQNIYNKHKNLTHQYLSNQSQSFQNNFDLLYQQIKFLAKGTSQNKHQTFGLRNNSKMYLRQYNGQKKSNIIKMHLEKRKKYLEQQQIKQRIKKQTQIIKQNNQIGFIFESGNFSQTFLKSARSFYNNLADPGWYQKKYTIKIPSFL